MSKLHIKKGDTVYVNSVRTRQNRPRTGGSGEQEPRSSGRGEHRIEAYKPNAQNPNGASKEGSTIHLSAEPGGSQGSESPPRWQKREQQRQISTLR